MDSFTHSLATGTIKNRTIQAHLYLKFCVAYSIDFLHPSILDVALYTRFLGNSFAAPGTIKNYLSGAKCWVGFHRGTTGAFGATEPGDILKHISSTSSHVTAPALSLSPKEIKIICDFIDKRPVIHKAVKACILIGFTSFLRASNLTSPSLKDWGGPHTLRCSDFLLRPDGLILSIHSTKTLSGRNPTFIQIFPAADTSICPIRAWQDYVSSIHPCPVGPAFITDQGTPLTTKPVVGIMRLALKQAGYACYNQVSLHSLRRGGARTAALGGASQDQLMNHGTWKTKSGLKPYILPDQRIVPRILASSLAS